MKYIWINPVTANMYNPAILHHFLTEKGYTQVEASSRWLETVKKKYKQANDTPEHTLIDMRCPKIIHFIDAYEIRDKVTIPEIEPILIHCGREISQREDLLGYEKIITTPCQALAVLGNSLNLPETTFIPWNQFLESLGGGLTAVPPQESPIPPGFFNELDCKMISVTEKQAICDLFENFEPNQFDLIELLWCGDGCHNGDGICSYK